MRIAKRYLAAGMAALALFASCRETERQKTMNVHAEGYECAVTRKEGITPTSVRLDITARAVGQGLYGIRTVTGDYNPYNPFGQFELMSVEPKGDKTTGEYILRTCIDAARNKDFYFVR